MSLFEFNKAEALVARRIPFRSLIMAAMRLGDRDSVNKLKEGWPNLYNELRVRLDDEKSFYINDKGQKRLGET